MKFDADIKKIHDAYNAAKPKPFTEVKKTTDEKTVDEKTSDDKTVKTDEEGD